MGSNIMPPPARTCGDEHGNRISERLSAQVEALWEERVRNFADRLATRNNAAEVVSASNPLEQNVDAFLDTLHSLRRLESLAKRAADGLPITESADLALIAENEEAFLRIVDGCAERGVYISRLLPAAPVPVG